MFLKNNYPVLRLMILPFVILLILIFNAWFLSSNFENVSVQEKLVSHTASVINKIDLVLSAAKDAETGVRGYLLTRKMEYLEPYRTGMADAWQHFNELKFLTQDNPDQQATLLTIQQTIQKRFSILQDLLEKLNKSSIRINSDSVQFSEGKTVMDALRAQADRMKETEQSLLNARAQISERSRYFFTWALILTTLLSVIVIASAFYQIGKIQLKTASDARQKSMAAEIASLISGDITLETAGQRVLEFCSRVFGSLAGRLFMYDQGDLKLVSSIGVNDNDSSGRNPIAPEGSLVHAAISRTEPWEINDIPADYWHISSSLGESIPKTITLLPFSFQNRPLGVFELASFNTLKEAEKNLLANIRDLLGVGLNAAQSRAHLQALLERTQQQSEEIQAQQEELKTNNEELEQQARALESQQQSLNSKNRELEMTQVNLEAKANELQRSSQYKSDFLAKMSHELRTPLNGLLILSTLLVENKEGTLTDRQREFARSINSAGNDLLLLINDILDLSRIEARKLNLRPEDFTVESLLRSKRRTFEPQAMDKGLKLIVEIPDNVAPVQMHTDRQRLEQILRNFISNAIKFTEKGSVTLKARIDEDKNFLVFSVADTGIGIPKDKQRVVFNAFEQADSSISRKYGGTGLGLTISQELASLLGGEISLQSEVGKGSEFILRIPIKLDEKAVVGAIITPAKALIPAESESLPPYVERIGDSVKNQAHLALQNVDPNKKTILVVEDDDAFRSSIVESIRSYDFQAVETGDGEVALAILNEHIPDAILLDIKLPGISGLGILEMIKQLPHLRHVPVHMVSALEHQHNALRMGALGYLTKPVTIEKVRAALDRISGLISKKLRRVLLIEDDERQNKAISELISDKDIEVIPVKTGRGAVKELKAKTFDCIILDLTLPDVSGFDVLSELSSLDISVPPIVIYTGKDLSPEEETYLRKYSESIVIKGARSPERLLDEVNLFLHRVESLLPADKRQMLSQMRSQEKSFDGKTVLIVDDDIRNVFALTSALESKGMRILVARDGVEALDSLDKHIDIDLVLMDIMMPKMDGFEAMRRIRQSNNMKLRNIPIVALTAKAMKEDHEKCMEAGASDYLPKPVNLDNLITVLRVWLAPKGFLS